MNPIAGEFSSFVIVGAINTVLTYMLFLFIQQYTHYWIAYTIAFVVGIVLSYLLNVLFVFKGGHSIGAMLKFPFIYLLQYLYGSLALITIVEALGIAKPIAMLIVIATSVLLTFLLVRLVFRNRPPSPSFSARQRQP
jgi:putative flippase GtrA